MPVHRAVGNVQTRNAASLGSQDDRIAESTTTRDRAEVFTIIISPGGLMSHWPFDEASGQVAEDVEGGNDGTLVGEQTHVGWLSAFGLHPSLECPGPFSVKKEREW